MRIFLEQLILGNYLFMALLLAWVLPWKGLALWKSAKLKQKPWFIIFLIVNTLGILEILYIFVLSKKKKSPAK